MLLEKIELEALGAAVIGMVRDPEYYHDDFWIYTQKIIKGLIYSNGKLSRLTNDWKEVCEFNALVKVASNVRKFSPDKWNEARKNKGHSECKNFDKGIYEYIHLIAFRDIYTTITTLSAKHARMPESNAYETFEMHDICDVRSFEEFKLAENRVDIKWLESRLGFKIGDEDE